jgi:GT2 family glycosyltransferase
MDLSIVIVNWNTAKLLTQCLESIYRTGSRYTFEIIMVDNGSSDGSVLTVEQRFPDVFIIQNNQNLGFAKANNRGIAMAQGRYYLLLNSDTIVLPGTLDELVHTADLYTDVGVLSPKLLNIDDTLQESWASFPSFGSELLGRNFRNHQLVPDVSSAYDVDWVSGACMLVRAKMVHEVGLLDEDYFMYSEEADWCFRIKKMGWKIWYLSNAVIYHLGGGSANRSSLTQLMLLYQGKLLFFRKHYGAGQAAVLRYGLALINTIGLIRRSFSLFGKDKVMVRRRLTIQSQLIICLLLDRKPAIST